jgi:ribosomal-protein-alanine N-acetyltransferase
MFRNYQIHTHLDWYDTDDWLNYTSVPMQLAWQRGRLVGLLAASTPLNHSSWIRLAAIHDQVNAESVMYVLWQALLADLHELGVQQVAVLILRDWIADMLPALGFHYQEDVVTLRRASRQLPELPTSDIQIRSFMPHDFDAIAQIDEAAFTPPWQLSLNEIRQATRMAAVCTVALQSDSLVGYQLSTFYYEGGHLARLAVAPVAQGTGVGRLLLGDLIQRFARRGIYAITVNTQSSNYRSTHLYTRFSFVPTGYNLAVWTTNL